MPFEPLEVTVTETQMAALAASVADQLSVGDCIALRGDLGAGKTTFARALIRAIMADPLHEVPSPTFALRQDYVSTRGTLVHFDLYRIAEARDLDDIGFGDAVVHAITLIEWPERAAAELPHNRLDIVLRDGGTAATRILTISGHGTLLGLPQKLRTALNIAD